MFMDKSLWFGKCFSTQKEALVQGVIDLEEQFQECLNDLKPKYQTKPKQVDAVQWFNSESNPFPAYYQGTCISSGDWIVDGKIVTNEDFEQDYEEVS